MELKEAVKRSQSEHFDYPDIINSDAGLTPVIELDLIGIPMWNRNHSKLNRKVILEIRTWKGISFNAIHFYGKIVVDGVYQANLSNPKESKNLTSEEEKLYPLYTYDYNFKIKRPLTKEENELDPQRWEYYDEGDYIEGYETIQELISDFKEIVKLRFTGNWIFYVQYPRGNKEKLNIL